MPNHQFRLPSVVRNLACLSSLIRVEKGEGRDISKSLHSRRQHSAKINNGKWGNKITWIHLQYWIEQNGTVKPLFLTPNQRNKTLYFHIFDKWGELRWFSFFRLFCIRLNAGGTDSTWQNKCKIKWWVVVYFPFPYHKTWKSHTHPNKYFIRMGLVLVIVSCVEGTQNFRLDNLWFCHIDVIYLCCLLLSHPFVTSSIVCFQSRKTLYKRRLQEDCFSVSFYFLGFVIIPSKFGIFCKFGFNSNTAN